jgi:hypothetical protein
MHPIIKAAAQTALCFLALNGCVLLGAATAWAEADAAQTSRPLCEEGRAVLAGRLAYLEARISPAPHQQQAWQAFKSAVRAAVEPLDALCVEGKAPGAPADPDRLERMEKSAAALQKMFAGLRAAIAGIDPVLTSAQRDILAHHILAPAPPFMPPFPPPSPGMPPPGGMFGLPPPPFAMTAVSCGKEPLVPPLF